jgi:hypothetical protein
MKYGSRTMAFVLPALSAAAISAQQWQTQPVFGAAIGGGPGLMAMDMWKGGNGGGRVCGRAYSNDLEKAELLRLEATGRCGRRTGRAAGLVVTPPRLDAGTSGLNADAGPAARFTSSASRRRMNLAKFVERSRAADPAGATAMERLFATTDVVAAIGRALAPVGLRTDDVADAYAVWWMSAWQAAHGDASTPDRVTAQAVRAQAAHAIAATPEFAQADDAMKQEFAEALLVQTALIDGMMEEYGSDPAMAAKIAASVRQGARAAGLDLDAMTLTEAGFVPAKKTGAADPAPGAPREALAATGDGKPGVGLLAAAGGAGLGAAFLIGRAMGRRG